MRNIKEKDIQYVYEVISESEEIQKLIWEIANRSPKKSNSDFIESSIDDSEEMKSLNLQISQLQTQLEKTKEKLHEYKNQADLKEKECEHLQGQIEILKKKERDSQIELQNKISEISKLEKDFGQECNKNAELMSELKQANATADLLKQQFEKPMAYLKMYQSLSRSTRNGLENVISVTNEITFIASCTNEDGLAAIWNYTKDLSNDSDREQDFMVLREIFDYFFDIYNDSLPEPKYVRDDVEIGDEFDDECHDRCMGSATSGDITEVILRGYRSMNTRKVIRRSLVKV
ncbi:MAG: hypothetical protein ACI4HI_00960 [Lachnospiraceae bacterium]